MAYKTKGSSAFKKVQEFKREKGVTGVSIMQLILLYCEENEIDEGEFGEDLKNDKNFRDMFKADLIYNHEARFHEPRTNNISEWE